MQAILLSIGDELALGQTVDTNTAWLAARLARLGIPTLMHVTVADDRDAIARALDDAARRADLVIVSGGLGPTADDLTREALADAMGADLVEDAQSLDRLRGFFDRLGRTMPDRNRVQATHPRGSTMILNERGTAPGIHATLHGAEVFVTPGVPREMMHMMEAQIEPRLDRFRGATGALLTATVNTFGLGESDAAERLGDLMQRGRNPTVGTTVSGGLCRIRVRAEAPDEPAARAMLDATLDHAEERLGAAVFGRDDTSLQQAVVDTLKANRRTVATAESCTGGLIGAMLTDVAGSSTAYLGGWVTYTNTMKTDQLGVPADLIERHGAVSEPVVLAMAKGARGRSGADYALSVSGVAGPGGGTDAKPVGTVWVGLSTPDGDHARLARLVGDRAAIRDRSAKCALQWLRLALLGEPADAIQWFAKAKVPA